MGVAYYIVLDQQDPGFDPFVNGKFLAQEGRRLARIAKTLNLPALDEFVSYSEDDMAAMQEEAGMDEMPAWWNGEQWFDPEEGLAWIAALRQRVAAEPGAVKNAEGVLADLDEYERVLSQAKEVRARWHLSVDV